MSCIFQHKLPAVMSRASVNCQTASHLEGVEQSHPVADLVHTGVAEVVPIVRTVGHAPGMDDGAILAAGVVPRQRRDPAHGWALVRGSER